MEKEMEDPEAPVTLAGGKKRKTEPSKEERDKAEKPWQEALRHRLQERRSYDVMVVKSCLLGHIKDPCQQKLREAMRNRVESYPMSVHIASLALMHLVRKMYRDMKDVEIVGVLGEFFNKSFIRHLMFGTGETSRGNDRAHALHEKYPNYRLNGTR
jgi:hypothetical protein